MRTADNLKPIRVEHTIDTIVQLIKFENASIPYIIIQYAII